MTIILLTLVGVIVSVVIGTIWYSNSTPMGRLHMQYLGFDQLSKAEQQKKIAEAIPGMPKVYGAQMLLSLLTSGAVVYIISLSMQNGLPFLMAFGFILLNWLCFMVPVQGASVLWGNVDRKIAWKKFFSDILANLVTVSAIAGLAGLYYSLMPIK